MIAIRSSLVASLAIALTGSVAFANPIQATFNFTGLAGVSPSVPGATITGLGASDLTSTVTGDITRGAGLTGSSASNRIASTGFATTFTADDFYTFTVPAVATAGLQTTIETLTLTWQSSGTGPANIVIRSSVDGFTGDLGSATGLATGSATAVPTFNLSGVTSTSAIEFRIYGFNASGGTGTGGLNALSFTGQVAPIPEPGTYALVALGLVGVAFGRRRLQRA